MRRACKISYALVVHRTLLVQTTVGLIVAACGRLSGCTPVEAGSPNREVGKPPLYRLRLTAGERHKPSYLLADLAYLAKELVTILTMAGLLFSLGWWVPAVLLLVLIPQGYIGFRLEENAWEVSEGKSQQLRRMEYYASVMLTDTGHASSFLS